MKSYKITSGGQISLPVSVRRRWAVKKVTFEDLGDQVVIRPVPDDPIKAFRGAFADRETPPSEDLRRRARAEEGEAEPRRHS